ncbi:epimerase [Mycobacterium sp. E802]|uniref:NAD-dependent epimerase/dehydratase family protein n=1 Tax=Mycobacterium sp. E802 TaxID=1834152 RepID=UPI0007FC0E4A|nr:NAD(P)-dependent oxidoreductase [Mycobacterium sp. E802]OBG81720.1 epimerase [Mycobacterium sp. E802]
MRVFVTGGTGAIGSHAVPALIDAGHSVTSLARTEAKARILESQGATPVIVSLFDRDALTAAFTDHDAVVNLASALPAVTSFLLKSAWRDCERVRIQGSATVVAAAQAAGVPRLIQESVAMLYTDTGSHWIDEDHPVDHYRISRGNHGAEANARQFAHTGGTATVLRFGVFYGPGAAHSEQILRLARRHIGFAPGRADSFISSIHLVDAATAVAAALHAPGGLYNIVDDQPITKRDYAHAYARAAGTRLWASGPGRLGLLLGERLTSLTRSLRVSNTRFKAAAHWQPRFPSVRDGLSTMAPPPHPAA